MAVPAIVKTTLASNASIDIFASLTGTGKYEVSFISGGALNIYSVAGSSSSDSVYLSGVGSPTDPFKFVWDSDTPLYLKNFQANPQSTFYMLIPVSTVGLTVNC